MSDQTDVLQGTLDLLIMRTLALERMHGWAIAQRIQQISGDLLRVQQGSLYPALHRLEHQGWITAEWGASENNRRARFYSLTQSRPQAARHRGLEVGPPVGRRQSRAAEDVTVRTLAHRATAGCDPVVFRDRRESDLREELQFHLERENPSGSRRAACRATPARLHARRVFGGVEPVNGRSAATRAARRSSTTCARDVRYAFRSFRRAPLAALTIVTTVALGLGLVAVVFTLLNAFVFRVDEVRNPHELFAVERPANGQRGAGGLHARAVRRARPRDGRRSRMRSRAGRTSTAGSTAGGWRARSSRATSSTSSASAPRAGARSRRRRRARRPSGHCPQPSRLVAALRERSRRARPRRSW